MLAIGIDPGTASTGFGVVRQDGGGRIEAVDFGVLSTAPDLPMPERLLNLHRQLGALLSLHRPESGAVETLFFQRNVSTAITVGQARGVILLTLAEAGIPVCEYSPREVKQAVAGYGGAEKRQMQEMVRVLLGMKALPRPDDAADALAVAICHLHTQSTRTRTGELT
jgi:crossover junction endodeoxyribonuclease RuvC